jgi:hypothetical protein
VHSADATDQRLIFLLHFSNAISDIRRMRLAGVESAASATLPSLDRQNPRTLNGRRDWRWRIVKKFF